MTRSLREIRNRYQITMDKGLVMVRLSGALLVLCVIYWVTSLLAPDTHRVGFTPVALSLVLSATFFLTLVILIWMQFRPRTAIASTFIPIQLTWDVISATGLVYLTGGLRSGFTSLYGFTVLLTALWMGQKAARLMLLMCLCTLAVVGVGLAMFWIPVPPDQSALRYVLTRQELIALLAINATALLMVGLLSEQLTKRLATTQGQLEQARAEVHELTRLNQVIFESLSTGLITTDTHWRLTSVNPAAAQLIGAPADKLIGTSFSTYFKLQEQPADIRSDMDRMHGYLIKVDGSERTIGYTHNSLLADQGHVFIFRDLTEILKLREQSAQSQKLAAMGQVAAQLAHEIRNPLTSISGSVQLVLESSTLADDERKLLDLVRREVERLNDLVTTMLNVGKPQAMRPTHHDISEVLSEVVMMAQHGLLTSKRVTLESHCEGRLTIHADPDQMKQVLWNLIKNAVSMSPEAGKVVVSINQIGQRVHITVQDDGPGFPSQDKVDVFAPFVSLRKLGTGLGLTWVKQIVEAHGGSIQLDNRRTHDGSVLGALVRIELPLGTPRILEQAVS